MYCKKTFFLSLIFVNFCSAKVAPVSAFCNKQALTNTVVLGSTIYVAHRLKSYFSAGRKEMDSIENQLRRAGVSVKKEPFFGIPMIGYLTTFRGYEHILSRYQKEIDAFQELQKKELLMWCIVPFLIRFGWDSSSSLYNSTRG